MKTSCQETFDKMHIPIVSGLLTAIKIALQLDKVKLIVKCRVSMLP